MKKWMFLSPILLLVIWSTLTYGDLVNQAIIPYPHKVLLELWRYSSSGEVISDILPTLKCLFLGMLMGTTIGISLGIPIGYFTRIYESLDFLIDFFRNIPATALLPLFMLIFGLGGISRIMIVLYETTFIILVSTIYGVKNGNRVRVIAAKTMLASKKDILVKVVLPDALPYIVAGLRVALSISLAITIISEMFIGADAGLGYKIMHSKTFYNIPNVFAVLIITGLVGYLLNKIFVLAETRIVHWHGQ